MPMSPWLASAGCRKNDGRAGARQRRGDLAADVPGLAHAGDDDAAGAGKQQAAGGREVRRPGGARSAATASASVPSTRRAAVDQRLGVGHGATGLSGRRSSPATGRLSVQQLCVSRMRLTRQPAMTADEVTGLIEAAPARRRRCASLTDDDTHFEARGRRPAVRGQAPAAAAPARLRALGARMGREIHALVDPGLHARRVAGCGRRVRLS